MKPTKTAIAAVIATAAASASAITGILKLKDIIYETACDIRKTKLTVENIRRQLCENTFKFYSSAAWENGTNEEDVITTVTLDGNMLELDAMRLNKIMADIAERQTDSSICAESVRTGAIYEIQADKDIWPKAALGILNPDGNHPWMADYTADAGKTILKTDSTFHNGHKYI